MKDATQLTSSQSQEQKSLGFLVVLSTQALKRTPVLWQLLSNLDSEPLRNLTGSPNLPPAVLKEMFMCESQLSAAG